MTIKDWNKSRLNKQLHSQRLNAHSDARIGEASRNPSKADLKKMLADAARNTAAIQNQGAGE